MSGVCRPYEYVNIRGNKCVNCTATTCYKKGSYPFHMDSSGRGSCEFYGSEVDPAKYSEDNFGQYATTNPKFRCISNLVDTNRFWIGGK